MGEVTTLGRVKVFLDHDAKSWEGDMQNKSNALLDKVIALFEKEGATPAEALRTSYIFAAINAEEFEELHCPDCQA